MKDMSLSEIKQKKNKLEDDIRNAILDFQKETEISVSKVNVDIDKIHSLGKIRGATIVSVEVYFDI